MAVDLFICPQEDSAPVTVEEIQQRLLGAGLPCRVEMHDEPWIVFEGHESDLVFTVEPDGRATSAVMQASIEDDPQFGEQVLAAFESFGWTCEEDSF